MVEYVVQSASMVGIVGNVALQADTKIVLKLYVSGQTANSVRAIANLRQICDEELSGRYVLDVIDVTRQPEVAERKKILATPALIKEIPPPLRRIVGDLSDREQVLLGLELESSELSRDGA